MSDQARQKFTEQLERLRHDYMSQLPSEFEAIRQLSQRLAGDAPQRADVEELHHRLHKLAGSGGTFGLPALSSAARALELQTRYWLDVGPENIEDSTRRSFAAALTEFQKTAGTASATPRFDATRVQIPADPTRTQFTVWLVEDDELFGRDLAHQLESFNYRVRCFTQLAEAATAARSERPDLLVVDVILDPDRNNATETLADHPELLGTGCPLVFITAHDDFASRVRAVRLGATGYFLKPLDIPRLIGRLTQILEQRHAPPERVLIVEDDTALAGHYRLVLRSAGMEVECLEAPERIIDKISEFRPELILMDMHMPQFSGPELAGIVRQHDNWASLPIVYLSAETDLDRQIQAMQHGADDFLTKPISDPQLVAAVRIRVERARVLEELISRDSLTGLLKHSSIKEAAANMLARARRTGTPVCMAMLDIDHFKKVNDGYGHAVGDIVISSLATLLRQRLRKSDIVGRYGGEEFVVVLPECSSEHGLKLMDDIRQHFADLHFNHAGRDFACTLTAGLACSADHPTLDAEALITAADAAMYEGKHGGRNQVRCARS